MSGTTDRVGEFPTRQQTSVVKAVARMGSRAAETRLDPGRERSNTGKVEAVESVTELFQGVK